MRDQTRPGFPCRCEGEALILAQSTEERPRIGLRPRAFSTSTWR